MKRLPFLFLPLVFLPLAALAQGSGEPIPGGCGLVGPNLVANPEFDEGNTAFTSDYLFNPGYICQFGQYTVSNQVGYDPNVICYNAPGFDIRTIWAASDRRQPGLGQFMLIDPSEATGATDDIWRQQLPVCPFTNYTFSLWAKNLYIDPAPIVYSGVNPEFEMEINSIPVTGYYVNGILNPSTSFELGRQPAADSAVWTQISGTWFSGSDSVADMLVRNLITGSQGNDLAIDGVFFGICGSEVSVTVLGSLGQCLDSALVPIVLNPTIQTVNSAWLYYRWFKGDSMLVSTPTPQPYTVMPQLDGSHFGDYQLRVFNDPLGITCAYASDKVTVFNSCETTFPVEWLDISARPQGMQAELRWSTAREQNNLGFEVELAALGQPFQTVGFVGGSGYSDAPQHYRFLTEALPAGRYLFRLRQIDHDGRSTQSPQSEVQIGLALPARISLRPQPARSETQVQVLTAEPQKIRLAIYTLSGEEIVVHPEAAAGAGTLHAFTLDVSKMAAGVYFVRASGAGFSLQEKMVVLP
jgi:hypothetical protein